MEPPRDVLKHVVDVHCHPTDSKIPSNVIDDLPITICAMATRRSDQALVANLARAHPDKVIPCFGFHPWFAHWISVSHGPLPSKADHYSKLFLKSDDGSDSKHNELVEALEAMLPSLPDPISIDDCISSLRQNFNSFPKAFLGEVGLDRAARVPYDHRAEHRKLTPLTVPSEHQLVVLEAQLELAVAMGRNVSLHSVKAQSATQELFDRMKNEYGQNWTRISVDLHSCGCSPESWKDIEKAHVNVFLSLSTTINGRSPNHRKLIETVSPDRLLVESDIHEIGQCATRTWDMILTVSEIKGWRVEERWDDHLDESQWGVVRRLEHNFQTFMKGEHKPRKTRREMREIGRNAVDFSSESESDGKSQGSS